MVVAHEAKLGANITAWFFSMETAREENRE
jgi:hypothetical protein